MGTTYLFSARWKQYCQDGFALFESGVGIWFFWLESDCSTGHSGMTACTTEHAHQNNESGKSDVDDQRRHDTSSNAITVRICLILDSFGAILDIIAHAGTRDEFTVSPLGKDETCISTVHGWLHRLERGVVTVAMINNIDAGADLISVPAFLAQRHGR